MLLNSSILCTNLTTVQLQSDGYKIEGRRQLTKRLFPKSGI